MLVEERVRHKTRLKQAAYSWIREQISRIIASLGTEIVKLEKVMLLSSDSPLDIFAPQMGPLKARHQEVRSGIMTMNHFNVC